MVRCTAGRSRFILMLILLAAFGLRLHQLGAQSLWYDETVSVHLAGKPVPELIAHTAGDIHPPGYYLLLRAWLIPFDYATGHASPGGHGLEFAAALLSLVFGMALIPLIYALGRRLYDEPTALLAAALTAISPFHVWYSQEVRMYTIGAALGLICLRCALQFVSRARVLSLGFRVSGCRSEKAAPGRHPLAAVHRRSLVVYVLAATAGLYTLYYFAFLLVALNVWVIMVSACRPKQRPASNLQSPIPNPQSPIPNPQSPISSLQSPIPNLQSLISSPQYSIPTYHLRDWFLAQAAVLLLYLPWLPIAWRQATDPPVPPWRAFTGMWDMLLETWGALSFGQSVEPRRVWPLLAMTVALCVVGLLTRKTREMREMQESAPSFPSFPLIVHTFGPLALIYLVSLVTPLYHVRYAFTYAPPFSLLLAAGIVALVRWRRWTRPLAVLALVAMLLTSGFSLHNLWTNPSYASDDHRAAARFLTEQWRPGDVILVNAGYSYTALVTYFQQPIAWRGRLSEYSEEFTGQAGAVIVQTGHIDGHPNLGWGDPRSDFYALPGEEAADKLDLLFAAHPRLWHYRIYDTVNDPQGAIRQLLEKHGELFEDRVFTGEANLRVQGYLPQQRSAEPPSGAHAATFGDLFTLHVPPCCGTVTAGQTLYAQVFWQVLRQPPTDYATSLRLVGPQGRIWSQPPDERPLGSLYTTTRWASGGFERQPLRLPLPADTPPGRYLAEFLLYDPATGEPLPITTTSDDHSLAVAGGSRLHLGSVEVVLSGEEPVLSGVRPLARFDYIELLEAQCPATRLRPGDLIPIELRWRARPSEYVDDYVVVLQLLAEGDRVIVSHESRPVDGRYPTSLWPPGYPVRDQHELVVPPDTPPGCYRLVVALDRASDGQRIPARRGLLGLIRSNTITLKPIDVTP